MYYRKDTHVNGIIYVQKTYNSGMINGHGLSGREKKTAEMSEKQRRHNEKMRIRNLTFLLQANFDLGDLNVSLHYPRGSCPQSEKEAQKNVSACLKRLKRSCPDMKYVYTTHTTLRGSIHHHLVISGVQQYQIEEAWADTVKDGKLSCGHTLYRDKLTYKKLASYLVADEKHLPHEKGVRAYNASRNLIRPEVEVEEVRAEKWSVPPKAPRGYRVADCIDGRDIYGAPYQIYCLVPTDFTDEIDLCEYFWTG